MTIASQDSPSSRARARIHARSSLPAAMSGSCSAANAAGLHSRARNGKASSAELVEAGLVGAARAVDLEIRQGEIFIIMGLSGSGKSTLVRCMSRLIEPTYGKVEFEGKDLLSISDAELIELRRHRMGMVFQNFALLPHLNVLENIAFPLSHPGRRPRGARSARPRSHRSRRPARPRAFLSARTVRRPAAARRHRPQPGHQAGDLVPRRAVLGARSADPPRDAGRADAAAGGAAQDDRLHHP